MIVFDLKCPSEHVFEAWFNSSDSFEEQRTAGILECPFCGDNRIEKAVMAPNVGSKSNQGQSGESAPLPVSHGQMGETQAMGDMPAELRQQYESVMEKVRDHVESNCDYVGPEFAEEARKIHYGESDPRGIYGEATPEESAELLEEGVEVMPLPGLKRRRVADA